ncbi:MAG TPA: SRPBCC family protein, partial [Ktedonobacterales bacterium]|nr:SRPBCC family protein [Ktedonobacterales bacterium]
MAQTPATEHTTPQRLTIEDSVLVEAPIEEVYQQWSDLNHFPDFMRNIISVTPVGDIGDERYHWI